MRTEILGVGFDPLTMSGALDCALELLAEGGFHMAVTPNAEMVQAARKDGAFAALLNGAHLVLPDGIGVIHASRILGRPLAERVPGVDFAHRLSGRMAEKGYRLFLLGARPGVAELAAKQLRADHPGLEICGTADGYFQDSAVTAERIRNSRADGVFVCLGSPRQEEWIARWGPETGAALLIGLGGTLDVFSGQVKRAPALWQRLGMEWLYRVLRQPSRIPRAAKLPGFLCAAVGARIRGK